ncbi:MAG: hypothetical protein ABIO70_06425 [Pseudomonadota bacterium]
MPGHLVLLLLGTAWAGCPAPVPVSELVISLELAEAAQADADLTGLHSSTDRAQQQLACLGEPVTRAMAARFQRTMGLRLLLDREMDQARRAFAAARFIEPGYRFPETLVPQGNPVHDEYQSFPVDNPALEVVPAPQRGHLAFDGREGLQRPASWPTVVQLFDEQGAVLASAWLWPGEPLPTYAPRPEAEPLVAPPAPHRPPLALLAGAGASAVASVTLLALSRHAAATWADPATHGQEDLDRLRGQANGLLLASGGAALFTAGLGVAVAVTW